MAAIDFGHFPADFPGVNMGNQAALTEAILKEFAIFNYTSGYRDLSLVVIPNTANPLQATAVVRAHGAFSFNGDTPLDQSNVFAIEVLTQQGYRLVVDGINVTWGQLKNALNNGNLFPLWAGQALDILGHVTLGDTLIGGSLGDEIWGYGGQDILTGNSGNDYLDGGAGKDTMRGGLGNDKYFVSHERDLIIENAGEGIDLVVTTLDGYRLPTNFEDLGLFLTAGAIDALGNAADNFIDGNNYANRLQGLGGDDTMAGRNGRDVLSGGDGNDELDGEAGIDQVRGGAGNDFLYWDAADLQLDGGTGLDTLVVKSGNLDLTGVPAGRVIDIERISMVGSTVQTLTLAQGDVLELSSTTDTIRVLGGSADRVNIVGNFTEVGTSGGFTTYKLGGGAKLIVEADMDVV